VQPLPVEEDLSTEFVTREGFCLGISKNHRLAKRATVLARDMDGEVVFLLPRESHPGLYDGIVEYIESTGAKTILREVMSFTHAMEIVAHNFGIALLPRSASRLTYMGVQFRPVTDKLLRIETALFLRRDSGNDRLRRFRRELLSCIRKASLEPY
jgi:DNA-binding transcriptional LysR family regulator